MMQKNAVKAVCVFTLVFFVMSMTGAAACSSSSCTKSTSCKMDAKNDIFTLNPCKATKCFNVLSNDIGAGKKVVTTGVITTAKGGKVTMKRSGTVCYTKPVSCSEGSDSFTYKAVNKCGKSDTAQVTLKFNCAGCSKCSSGKCPTCTSCK